VSCFLTHSVHSVRFHYGVNWCEGIERTDVSVILVRKQTATVD